MCMSVGEGNIFVFMITSVSRQKGKAKLTTKSPFRQPIFLPGRPREVYFTQPMVLIRVICGKTAAI